MINNNDYAPIEQSPEHIPQIMEDLPMTEEATDPCAKQEQEVQAQGAVNTSSDCNKKTSVQGISKSIFTEMKRVFPQAKSNAALMEAVAYIFTNGKCEISPKAMELVKSYNSGIDIHLLSERVAHLSEEVKYLKSAV